MNHPALSDALDVAKDVEFGRSTTSDEVLSCRTLEQFRYAAHRSCQEEKLEHWVSMFSVARCGAFCIESGMNLVLRTPPEPAPPPVKEPPDDSPENPHAPVREPDPVEPAQI